MSTQIAAAVDRARLLAAAGRPVDDRLELPDRARRALALADRLGAPLLPVLDAAAAACDDDAAAIRAIRVASAQARVVAAALLAAPALLVPILGRLLGLDLLAFYRRPLGLAVAGGAGLLIATGGVMVWLILRRLHGGAEHPRGVMAATIAAMGLGWLIAGPGPAAVAAAAVTVAGRRRARRVAPHIRDLDEVADLAATAVSGGVPPAQALRLATDGVPDLPDVLRRQALALELGIAVDGAAPGVPAAARLLDLIATAEETGAAVVPSLRRLAADLRAESLARDLAAAERLPALLTVPTALCLLPASLLLVGAPLLAGGFLAAGT